MSKTIWFINHYSYPNNVYPHQRTNNYAKFFQSDGYKVRVFCSSQVHRTSVNLITDRMFYKEVEDGIPFTLIRTRNYRGNGIQRILNMIDFFFGFLRVTKHYEHPDIIVSTSVHPLAPLASIIYAKRRDILLVTETADLWPETLVSFNLLHRLNPITLTLYMLERYVYTKSDKLIFTMEGFEDYLSSKSFSEEVINKSLYLNNSLSCKELVSTEEPFQLNGDKKKIRFFYFGSLGDSNAVEKMIEFIIMTNEILTKKCEFHILGHGEKKTMFEQLDHFGNVYLYDSIQKNRLSKVAEQCNFLFLFTKPNPIYQYGISANKLFDYLCLKKPIIHNYYGKYDIVTKYQVGYEFSFDLEREKYSFIEFLMNHQIENINAMDYELKFDQLNKVYSIDNQYNKLKKFLFP